MRSYIPENLELTWSNVYLRARDNEIARERGRKKKVRRESRKRNVDAHIERLLWHKGVNEQERVGDKKRLCAWVFV